MEMAKTPSFKKLLDGNRLGRQTVGEHTAAEHLSPKTRKRPSGKTASRLQGTKVKSTIHLSLEASQRLDIHATMMGMDRSGLVEKLITEHLRRWVVSDRGGSETSLESSAE